MSKILYAWELGANLGHVGAFLPLARELRVRGNQIHWAVAQTASAAQLLAQEGYDWLQAPLIAETVREGPPLSYCDILLRFGYARECDLLGLVVAWRELIRLTGAHVLLADHAPTAILAARTLGLPVVLFSFGFFVPPRQRPLPTLRPWSRSAPGQLEALEQAVLTSINAILGHFGRAPLTAVADLFEVAEDALLGFPEIDHYADRGPARYWGCLPDAGVGAAPVWPALEGKRIFAYLRSATQHHEAALAALHTLGQPTVVFFPEAPAQLLARYAAAHLCFSTKALDLAQTAREADAALTYASASTVSSFLLKGKPLLLLPGHIEQFLLARRVEQLGAGLLVHPEQAPTDLPLKLRRILFDAGLRSNAQAFAHKYAAFSQEVIIGNMTRRIEALAQAEAPASTAAGQAACRAPVLPPL